jgi:predicted nucleotidyltransferase
MNYHSNEWVMNKVKEHLDEALNQDFSMNEVVGIFCQGSTNYGLDMDNSDVDTKLIVLPNFSDIVFNRKPCSTTHVRENNEHIDYKDLRLMLQTFRKQNLNFMEILFTDYKLLNGHYSSFWNLLVEHNEEIARYNPNKAVATMKGIALEKYHAMEHEYPSKVEVLAQFGYDPKQLLHLLRVEEYLRRYIDGEPYADCLHTNQAEYLKQVKMGLYDLNQARQEADHALEHVLEMAAEFREKVPDEGNPEVDKLLDYVQYKILYDAMKGYFNGN